MSRKKTHRGSEGQARAGNNAGGHAYGYHHVPVEDTGRRDAFGRPVIEAAAQHSARKAALEACRTRLSELDQEVGHLIDAIAKGLLSPALRARLEAAESERSELLSDRGGQSERGG